MYSPNFSGLRCFGHTWDEPSGTPAEDTKSLEGLLVAQTMGSIGVHDRVCGLCGVPYGEKGRQEGKHRQEHHFGKKAGARGHVLGYRREEWRIGICMSLQAGWRRKGS
jgi:hypothetical protein